MHCADAYFQLGGVFAHMGQPQLALGFYAAVVRAWFLWLQSAEARSQSPSTHNLHLLAQLHLIHVLNSREDMFGDSDPACGEVHHVLGLLALASGNAESALFSAMRASELLSAAAPAPDATVSPAAARALVERLRADLAAA